MKILELHKNSFAILLLAHMALVMLPGCASTEEEAEADAQSELCDEMGAGNSGCL